MRHGGRQQCLQPLSSVTVGTAGAARSAAKPRTTTSSARSAERSSVRIVGRRRSGGSRAAVKGVGGRRNDGSKPCRFPSPATSAREDTRFPTKTRASQAAASAATSSSSPRRRKARSRFHPPRSGFQRVYQSRFAVFQLVTPKRTSEDSPGCRVFDINNKVEYFSRTVPHYIGPENVDGMSLTYRQCRNEKKYNH